MLFEEELKKLINRYSYENGINTPDFILAEYIMRCLANFNHAVNDREQFYGRIVDKPPQDITKYKKGK